MELSLVAPELREPLRRVERIPLPFDRVWGLRVVRTLQAVMPARKLEGVTITQVRTADGAVRLYHPATRRSSAALFWIHGGGLLAGRPVQNDYLCALTAREVGILVVAGEYRKAPEHPFPAALNDCFAGWRWLQREASPLDVDRKRIALGGESAGGGLAASLAQRLLDLDRNRGTAGGETLPVAQWLFCPMLDDRTAARHELDGENHFVWNNRVNRFGWRSYLAMEPGAESVPSYAVPARREDLRGLPPSWIGVGDIDLFYEEDRFYAERLRDAGVPVTFEVVPGAPHGFVAWAPNTALAQNHVTHAQTWLRHALTMTDGEEAKSEEDQRKGHT
ncbi:MAG: alpha/beta hydrolase [Ktedonobacterales bacterium]